MTGEGRTSDQRTRDKTARRWSRPLAFRKDFCPVIQSDAVCKDRLWLSVPVSLVALLLLNSPDPHWGTFISVIVRSFSHSFRLDIASARGLGSQHLTAQRGMGHG